MKTFIVTFKDLLGIIKKIPVDAYNKVRAEILFEQEYVHQGIISITLNEEE